MRTARQELRALLVAGLAVALVSAACSGSSTAISVPDIAPGEVACVLESENAADEVIGPLAIGDPVEMTLPDLTEIRLSVGNNRFFYSYDATSRGGFDKEYSDVVMKDFEDPIVVYEPGERTPVIEVVRLTYFKG